MEPAKGASSAGVISRSATEIERVLVSLHAASEPVFAMLDDGSLLFSSQILHIDPQRQHFVVAASDDEVANAALLARPRVTLATEVDRVHLEISAADPRRSTFEGRPAIQLCFPEVMATHPRRTELRIPVPGQPPLKCVADAHGIAPFDGQIVDIGSGGIAFLVYAASITLEPGTLLKGCRIEHPGRAPAFADLEVRYSRAVTLTDGRRATRSGCRFINPSNDLLKMISSFMGVAA